MSSGEIDIATCEDEEALVALLNKTDEANKRKLLRSRIKELREKESKLAEERKKARDAQGPMDSVKMRAEMAVRDKERTMKAYDKMAATSIMASTSDPLKDALKRKEQEKAELMKQYEELAKTSSVGMTQNGLERIKQIEQEYDAIAAQLAMQQFDNFAKLDHQQKEKAALIMSQASLRSDHPEQPKAVDPKPSDAE